MKKLLLITAISAVFLTACGGEGGSANAIDPVTPPADGKLTDAEIKDILGLPDMPDEDENNSTVLGVIGDNNIRDDIENYIGLNYYDPNDPFAVNILFSLAATETLKVKAYENKDPVAYTKASQEVYSTVSCYYKLYGTSAGGSKEVIKMLDNTGLRAESEYERSRNMMAGVGMIKFVKKSTLHIT